MAAADPLVNGPWVVAAPDVNGRPRRHGEGRGVTARLPLSAACGRSAPRATLILLVVLSLTLSVW